MGSLFLFYCFSNFQVNLLYNCKVVEEITVVLISFDLIDSIKYDYALSDISVFKGKKEQFQII